MTFGNRLVALREERKMSRQELADKLEIPYTTLRNYEQDLREPGHTFLITISKLFDVSVDYLVGLAPEKEEKDELMEQIQEIVEDLDEDERKLLLSRARAIRNSRV